MRGRGPQYKARILRPSKKPVIVTMRLLAFLPTIGLVGQALSVSHSCYAQSPRGGEVPSDKDVRAYFTKLVPTTKSTLLHDTTGPEAGADVRVNLLPNTYLSASYFLSETTDSRLRRSELLRQPSQTATIPSPLYTGCATRVTSIMHG
jgi:hypothetical protein